MQRDALAVSVTASRSRKNVEGIKNLLTGRASYKSGDLGGPAVQDSSIAAEAANFGWTPEGFRFGAPLSWTSATD
jgi:hypothetical protein